MQISLSAIEPEWTKEKWLQWLMEEIADVRLRFGNDKEALQFWPDDYYQKMENWWAVNAHQQPVQIKYLNGVARIEDGWHRIAISHKLGMQFVPVEILS